MKFALVSEEKVEPTAGAKGFCPGCGALVIAKCGRVKVHHWAHKGVLMCDPWWENETAWHRAWKAHFPVEQQEVRHQDEDTKEWHIADVKVPSGLVYEFQHSAITHAEIQSREAFYKKMLWIVDATRLKKTAPAIEYTYGSAKQWQKEGFRAFTNLEGIPFEFRDSRHVVLFDLGPEKPIYCLLPGRVLDAATMVSYNRQSVVDALKKGSQIVNAAEIQQQLTNSIVDIAQNLNVPITYGFEYITGAFELKRYEDALLRRNPLYRIMRRR